MAESCTSVDQRVSLLEKDKHVYSLVSDLSMNEDKANSDMAQTCLTYLLQFNDKLRIGNVVESYNFLSHAATFWRIHVKKINCSLS